MIYVHWIQGLRGGGGCEGGTWCRIMEHHVSKGNLVGLLFYEVELWDHSINMYFLACDFNARSHLNINNGILNHLYYICHEKAMKCACEDWW